MHGDLTRYIGELSQVRFLMGQGAGYKFIDNQKQVLRVITVC